MTSIIRCEQQLRGPGRLPASTRHCQRLGTIERDGRWYCGQHDPQAASARLAARRLALREAAKDRLAAARDRCAALGGRPAYGRSGAATGGIVLSAAEADRLRDALAASSIPASDRRGATGPSISGSADGSYLGG